MRAQIVAAAIRLFSEHGIEATTVDQIAAAADVGKGTIYNYFQTKSDFLTVEMTYSGKELIDYLIKNVGAEFGRSSFTKDFPAQAAKVSGSGHINK